MTARRCITAVSRPCFRSTGEIDQPAGNGSQLREPPYSGPGRRPWTVSEPKLLIEDSPPYRGPTLATQRCPGPCAWCLTCHPVLALSPARRRKGGRRNQEQN